ncbi:MAG: hypothetical protein QJR09_05245 [Micrococcus sp.]|nr:hypothetical protein [Micrococcus sp.]
MGPRLQHRPGEIFGLVGFLRDHGEAVEYHLLTLGLKLEQLGTDALSWRDLWVIITRAPAGSAIHRSVDPEAAAWASGEINAWLFAAAVDLLAHGNWQRQGKRNARKPEPVPRPGEKSKGAVFGADPIPVSEFDAWWESAA